LGAEGVLTSQKPAGTRVGGTRSVLTLQEQERRRREAADRACGRLCYMDYVDTGILVRLARR